VPGVQFFGAKSVLQAFNARGLQTWGLFQSKQFINAGDGAEELSAFLDMLSTASDAVYTLKVFKEVDSDDITDKSECNGSFNFKLTAAGAVYGAAAVSGTGNTTGDVIVNKIRGIVEEEITEAIDRRLNGEGRKKDWGEIISGYMEDPESLIGVVTALRGLFVPKTGSIQPATIGTLGVAPPQNNHTMAATQTQEQIMQRIAAAIDILQKNDPKILEHLEKLAMLSQDDPDLFGLLIKKINAI
jgi:hypothetical protein